MNEHHTRPVLLDAAAAADDDNDADANDGMCSRGGRGRAGDATGYDGDARARPNGLPSESRQIAHRAPGWITLPPSAVTCSSAVSMSPTVK